MEDENSLIKERLRKLEEIRKKGINPYPYSYTRTHSAAELLKKYGKLKNEEHTKDKVSAAGRIVSLRRMGKASFCHIQDESGRIQLYFNQEMLGEEKYSLLKELDIGDIIGVSGVIFKTRTGETTVEVASFELLAKSLRPLPEKFHGLKDIEMRYRKRYLDLIVNPEVKETFVLRSKIINAIREYLNENGYMEVQTPILQPIYGGGNAKPFSTKLNAWDMNVYMRIAYEMYLKRLMVGGFEKIYDLSYCFRNEGADKTHNPEFTMIEIQTAYVDYNYVMKLTEEIFNYAAKKVLGTTKLKYGDKIIDLKAPWKRMTMVEALKEYADIDVNKLSPEEIKDKLKVYNIEYEGEFSWGLGVLLLFEELCESKLIQPTFIMDHPKEACSLSKIHRNNPKLIERVEPFINGWEVGNGYSELNDPILQRKLLEEQAKELRGGMEEAHPMDEDFVEALEYGLPPNAGMGIGIDRMVMLFTGSETIRDVILFPTMKPTDKEMTAEAQEKKFKKEIKKALK